MILRTVLAVASLCLCVATSAGAEPIANPDWMASVYSKKHGMTYDEASQRLQTQSNAGDIASQVTEAMGDSYAGLWFDIESGRFKVAYTDGGGIAVAKEFVGQSSVSSSIDLVKVEHTWNELLELQESVASSASKVADESDQSNRSYEIGPDVKKNEVYVAAPHEFLEEMRASIKQKFASSQIDIAFRALPATFRSGTDSNCSPFSCGRPLQGGVSITSQGHSCTAGVVARGNWSPLSVWLITAGHCFDLNSTVTAINQNTGRVRPIGPELGSHLGLWGDMAAIRIDNANWYSNGITWQNKLAVWGVNEDLPVANVQTPFVGQATCHTGINTYMSAVHKCGDILERNLILGTEPNQVGAMTKTDACGGPGDSGGPYFVNYATVVGIHRGPWYVNSPCAGNGSYFTETKYIFDLLNLSLYL